MLTKKYYFNDIELKEGMRVKCICRTPVEDFEKIFIIAKDKNGNLGIKINDNNIIDIEYFSIDILEVLE